MSNQASFRCSKTALALILIAYLALGAAYTLKTPRWEAPDEPAHFNYILHLAEGKGLPVLRPGDYPHEYLEELKAARFPAEMSVEPLRYEFYQPPLYYALGAVIWRLLSFLGEERFFALRLFSVALGGGLLYLAWRIVREIFPQDRTLALGTAAFVAFTPMHVAMMAAVNNDSLAEIILAGVMWQLIVLLKRGEVGRLRLVALGVLLGAGLLTKTTTSIALPLALVFACLLPGRRENSVGYRFALIFLPVLLLALPWLLRNAMVYGDFDLLGWKRHSEVVVGQPRTAEWLARLRAFGLGKELLLTTFRSFWAQFGWMGVLVDERIYLVLAFLCGLAGVGFVFFLISAPWGKETLFQKEALMLLASCAFLTLVLFMWYNLQFVQHQGRYLFPALIPFGLAFTLGLREALSRKRARTVAGFFLLLLLGLGVWGFFRGHFSDWGAIVCGGVALVFFLRGFLPARFDAEIFALSYLGLFVLDIVCLWGFIIPYLK